jgi:hypothetical protein
MKARIHWKTKEEGGRRKPPAGVGHPPYATIVRFKDTSEPWPPLVAWSLVVEKVVAQSNDFDWVADVHFLVDEAPVAELRMNREFELYEGGKCVAAGVLIEDEGEKGGEKGAKQF